MKFTTRINVSPKTTLAALAFGLMAVLASSVNAQPLRNNNEGLPDGRQLMRQVRAALPNIPLRLEADLQSRNPRGEIVGVMGTTIELDWGATPPAAQYHIRDRFGADRERLRVEWPGGADPILSYSAGDPLEEQPLDSLNQALNGLELTWADLTLSFLWWEGAQTVGFERVRGRFCYIVDVPAPAGDASRYLGVRLWIDPEVHLLMQAEAFDQKNERVRSLQVKNIRKIDEIWMVQNLDVYSFPSRNRVTLRVRQLKTLDDSTMWEE